MSLHPSAWVAWLTGVAVYAFLVSNPIYLLLALGAVLVVHLSFPSDGSAVSRAVRVFLVLGVVVLVVRLVFVALLPNPGETRLVTIPKLELPQWLGALELGGDVSAEVLAAGLSEGLALVVILAAFGVFNAHGDTAGLVRAVPAAFRDVGLVVSIALAFVPGMLRTVRDVRDAQRLRGEKGVRRLAPSLAVPVLGASLERSLLLAESMDARGYGHAAATTSSRIFLWAGLGGLIVSVAGWAAGFAVASVALAMGGTVAILWGFRAAAKASGTTRLGTRPVTSFDVAVMLAAAAACALVAIAGPDASYDPYPSIAAPAFAWRTAALVFLLTLPALGGAELR